MTDAQPGRGYAVVLARPSMRPIVGAHAVSMLGTVAAEVALSILVYQRSHSPLLSALVLVASFVPYAIGGTLLASLADRYPARRCLVTCDLLSAAAVAGMLIPGIPVAGLLALVVVTGLVSSVFQGARAASLACLLPTELFPLGRSLLRTVSQSCVLAGFAGGAVVVATVGPRAMLTADVASFLASAALLAGATPATPGRSATAHGERSTLGESVAGLRYVWSHPRLRTLLLLAWAGPAFGSVSDGLAAAYTAQVGARVTSAGVLFTGYAIGLLAGEVLLSRQSPTLRRRALRPLALLVPLPLLGFVVTPGLWPAAALLVISGVGLAYNQALDPILLAAIDPDRRGAVFTLAGSGLMTVQGLGIAAAGATASLVAPNLVMVAAGALGLVVLAALLHRAVRAEDQPNARSAPDPVTVALPGSG